MSAGQQVAEPGSHDPDATAGFSAQGKLPTPCQGMSLQCPEVALYATLRPPTPDPILLATHQVPQVPVRQLS